MTTPRIAVVGGGISGLAAAHRLLHPDDRAGMPTPEVVVHDGGPNPGGRLRATPFAGVAHVDEGADAMLARVPDAVALAHEVGLGDLVHPEPVSAAVWMNGKLHPIPEGLMLGVPRRLLPLARNRLLTWRGTARAAIEPLLPRSDIGHDSIGRLIRARFGDEVHDRIVDALVGSIYAADTDRSSLAEVPQLAGLASSRSLLLAARSMPSPPGTATAAAAPIFASPRNGTAALAAATRTAVTDAGGEIRPTTVSALDSDGDGWRLDDERFDAVVLATSAGGAATLLRGASPEAGDLLRVAETADVAMVALHLPADQWSDELVGKSGYLVPKSVQRLVTAVSFGSQKWAHWSPPDGGEILRVSLGRDGLPVLQLSDEEILAATLTDLETHLGIAFSPLNSRITRWEGAFPQYRPHHRDWVARVTDLLPSGIEVAGAAYRGIGIPACVRDGRRAADAIAASLAP